MSNQIPCEVLRHGLLEHAAVQAWNRLEPMFQPEAVEALQVRHKTAVFRLTGAGSQSSIIAKKCRRKTAWIERLIYPECLTGISPPACYGFLEEDSEYCWLFLEDASGLEYSPLNRDHRVSAGRWLGTVHTLEISEELARRLPNRGLTYYLGLLRSCRISVARHFSNPELPPQDIATLYTAALYLDRLESHWAELEAFCSAVPRSLVHGDFAVKNARLRREPAGLALLVFDWENGGWGFPATDLCQFNGHTLSPDLETYSMIREQRGHQLELWRICQLALYGSIFRLLEDIWWKAPSLEYEGYRYLAGPISSIAIYSKRMADVFQALGWHAVSHA
jgi:hypothetical protein